MDKKYVSQAVLQNILQHTDIGIHVIDENRRTIVYNKVMAQLEGLKAEQVLQRDLLDIFPSLNEDTSTLIKVLNTEKPIIDKTQTYINYKGQKITTVNSTIPLFWEEKIVGALEIAKDITYLKRLSDQLMDLQRELKCNNHGKYRSKNRIKNYTFSDIIGKDENMIKAIEIGKRASNSPSTVLLYGETGTGKELFAQSIHYEGIRKNRPFIAQNCAAIPEPLLEGILFGTDKGGFTGAIEREGIFEQANGGTLLLDEINSMSWELQSKLLRVLQEGYIRRIGGIKDILVDVKIIATTNEEPLESVKKGTLRKDLYYRLNVVYIDIPPLRDRRDDIPILCDYFIHKYNPLLGKSVIGIKDDIIQYFYQYSWPGNVRELENSIESAMNYAPDNRRYLQREDFISCHNIFKDEDIFNLNTLNMERPLPEYLEEMEKDIINRTLEENKYNISKTAKKLGIKRQTLQHKIKKYNSRAK